MRLGGSSLEYSIDCQYLVQTGKGHKGYMKNYWKSETSALYLKNSVITRKFLPLSNKLWGLIFARFLCHIVEKKKKERSKTTRRLRWLANQSTHRNNDKKYTGQTRQHLSGNRCLPLFIAKSSHEEEKDKKNPEDCFWNVCEKLHEIDVSARYVFKVFEVIPTISLLKFAILIEKEISVSKWKINWRRFVCKTGPYFWHSRTGLKPPGGYFPIQIKTSKHWLKNWSHILRQIDRVKAIMIGTCFASMNAGKVSEK